MGEEIRYVNTNDIILTKEWTVLHILSRGGTFSIFVGWYMQTKTLLTLDELKVGVVNIMIILR